MSDAVHASVEIDATNLICVQVDYGKLSVLLSNIVSRLSAVEARTSLQQPVLDPPAQEVPQEASQQSAEGKNDALNSIIDKLVNGLAVHDDVLESLKKEISAIRLDLDHRTQTADPRPPEPDNSESGNEVSDLQNRVSLAENKLKDVEDILRTVVADRKNDAAQVSPPAKAQEPNIDLEMLVRDLQQEIAALKNDSASLQNAVASVNDALDRRAVDDKLAEIPQVQKIAHTSDKGEHEGVAARIDALEALLTKHLQSNHDFAPVTDFYEMKKIVDDLNSKLKIVDEAQKALQAEVELAACQIRSLATAPLTGTASTPQISQGQLGALATAIDQLASQQKDLKNDVGGLKQRPEVNPEDFASKAALSTLRDSLGQDLKDLRSRTESLHDTIARLQVDLSGKANKTEISRDVQPSESIESRFVEIFRLLSGHDSKIADLFSKMGTNQPTANPLTTTVAAKVNDLEQRLASLSDQIKQSVDAATVHALEARMMELLDATAAQKDWANQQVLEIRATVDHIHHTKADSSQVASKAERDYVENALEKLMREVEQVLNSTNAGLIDTLDKSLGILRDMIDGKASKSDLARLKSTQNEDTNFVPEGLTGYKSYRCLGCNRTVDAMRTRPMGANFSNFMNRLPASPRQPPRTADEGARKPVGLIAGTPP